MEGSTEVEAEDTWTFSGSSPPATATEYCGECGTDEGEPYTEDCGTCEYRQYMDSLECQSCGGDGPDCCDEWVEPTGTLEQRLGRCYELACMWVLTEEAPDLRYVQGTITHGRGGATCVPYGHGWVTFTKDGVAMAYDVVFDYEAPLATYQAECGAVEIASWSPEETAPRMMAEGHYGPWHAEKVLGR